MIDCNNLPPLFHGGLCAWLTCVPVRVCSGVNVSVLIGYWNYSIPLQAFYLRSLNELPNVVVRYFIVPGMAGGGCKD